MTISMSSLSEAFPLDFPPLDRDQDRVRDLNLDRGSLGDLDRELDELG